MLKCSRPCVNFPSPEMRMMASLPRYSSLLPLLNARFESTRVDDQGVASSVARIADLHIELHTKRGRGHVAKKTRKAAAKKKNGRSSRRAWSKQDVAELKGHSKKKTPVAAISRTMKRTVGALRQQAFKLGLSLGHRR
jgi:hypothetical protein